MNLTNAELIGLAIVLAIAIAAIAVAVWLSMRRRRATTAELRQRFGTEYDRAVRTHGRKAQARLLEREKRVELLDIRELDPAERDRFLERWKSLQSRFVDSPKGAVTEADDLVSSVMQARGYPVSDFEQRAADISVDHPRVTENYRAAHAIALRLGKGETNTEDLRTAMIHYRALFEELVQTPVADRQQAA